MVRGEASTLIRRAPGDVFAFVILGFFDNYRRWSPEVVLLQPISKGPLRVGSTVRQVRVDRGRRTDSTFRVTEYEAGRRVDFQGINSPYRVSYRFAPAEQGTRLVFMFELTRLELFMRPFEKLIRQAVQEGAQRTVSNIKGLMEAQTPADSV
jgi:hypothetical protein